MNTSQCSRDSFYDHFADDGQPIDWTCANPEHTAAIARRAQRGDAWAPMVRRPDGGDTRDFVDGEPVHCGAALELQSIEYKSDDYGEWTVRLDKGTHVRYELAWGKGDGKRAMLHTCLGGHEFVTPVHPWMRFRWPKR